MENRAIISKIEKFVSESLNHRYNPRVKSVNSLVQSLPSETKIENFDRTIEILPGKKGPWQKLVYRLPQTRIYYTLYQNLTLKVQFIDYFNVHLILVQGEKGSIKLRNKSRLQIRLLDGQPISNEAASWPIKAHEASGFLVAPLRLQKKFNSVLHLLNEIRQNEYQLNPVSKLQTENGAILSEIDRDFARLEGISLFGKLEPTILNSTIWLYYLEFYLQGGHFQLLLRFLKGVLQKQPPLDHTLLRNFLNRFIRVLQLNHQRIPAWLQKLKLDEVNSEQDLFETIFLQEFDVEGTTTTEKIQQLWEAITIPALELYWQKAVQNQPESFLAFLLLSVQNHFLWVERAFQKIYSWLAAEHRSLFSLLFALARFSSPSIGNAVKVGTGQLVGYQQRLQFDPFSIQYQRFGKTIFSVLSHAIHPFSVKLNQFVNWEFDVENNQLTILPVLVRPPLENPQFKWTHVSIGRFTIKVPLIWPQFTLLANGVRLKWLRKKKRFQLSVKVPKHHSETILVDGVLIQPENVYAKYYFPIHSSESRWFVSLMDPAGVRVQKLHARREQIIVKGFALDFQGFLREQFNFQWQSSRRNHQIDGLGIQAQLLPVPRLPLSYRLSARRCDTGGGQVEHADPFLQKYFYQPGSALVHQLVVWIMEEEEECLRVKQIFEELLGFIPKIIVTSANKFNPTPETINMLVSLTPVEEDEIEADYGGVNIQLRGKGRNIKYLWLNGKSLRNGLKHLYFMQKIEKISEFPPKNL